MPSPSRLAEIGDNGKAGAMKGERLFEIAYALAARDGREGVLFGDSLPAAQEAFSRGAVAGTFPELWFELPLSDEPWFDLHMLIARSDVQGDAAFAGLGGAYANALAWFANSDDTRQLALSFDSGAGETQRPAVQLLLDCESRLAARGFLAAAGRTDLVPAYQAFTERMPKGWYACYLGLFPGRADAEWVRVECIVGDNAQQSYAEDPRVLCDHLGHIGMVGVDGTFLEYIAELARSPYPLELQFDVGPDGTALSRLGASMRFQPDDWANSREDAERVFGKVESWGLSDARWKFLAQTAFSKHAKLGSEEARLWCFPAFVKLRWREGAPPDAKVYLMAGLAPGNGQDTYN